MSSKPNLPAVIVYGFLALLLAFVVLMVEWPAAGFAALVVTAIAGGVAVARGVRRGAVEVPTFNHLIAQ